MAATRTHAQLFDSHGFAVMSAAEEFNMSYEDSGIKCIPSVCERFKEVLAECESCDIKKPSILWKKCRKLIKAGGHNSIRGDIWRVFLGISETKARTNFDYKGNVAELCERLNKYGLTESTCDANIRRISALLDGQYLPLSEEDMKWLRNARQIMLDIGRTFPTHRLYIGETKEKNSLLRVLMVYAKFNTSVGYCQGMAYIAALLLMHMTNEEDVFWSILTIFDSEKYLARFYDSKLSRMQTCGEIFSLLLKDRQTKLAQHLDSLSIHPLMYITSWFMCLFTTLPCWDTVLTICDLIFLEGYQCLFCGALAILEVCSDELLAMDRIEAILPFIQKLPSRLASHQVLIPVLWRTSVTCMELERYRSILPCDNPATVPTGTEFKTPKKRRTASSVASTPVTRSLLSRIITALTPVSSRNVPAARDTAVTATSSLFETPTRRKNELRLDSECHTVRLSSRKRKRENQENSDPDFNVPAIEMKELLIPEKRLRPSPSFYTNSKTHSSPFSPSLSIPTAFIFSPTPTASCGTLVYETPSSKLAASPKTEREMLSPAVRRSERVAQRKRSLAGMKSQPSLLSFLSPRECPLQDRLHTRECTSGERAAFQSFATATSAKTHLNTQLMY